MNDSYRRLLGLGTIPADGAGLDVALADSLLRLPPDWESDEWPEVVASHDLSHTSDGRQHVWVHGKHVFEILAALLPAARFHLYRVKTARRTRSDRAGPADATIPGNAIVKSAIGQAIDDDVDLLNLSLGRLHRFCSDCVFERPTAQLAATGTTAVAAIGNEHTARRHEHVLCPGLTESVLSVGGVTNGCDGPVPPSASDRRIWVDTRDVDSIRPDEQGPLCSFGGCTAARGECGEHRTEVPYEHNIQSYRDNPQLLAPVHKPDVLDPDGVDGLRAAFAMGTSFAAPLVAGVAGRLVAASADDPTPQSIRDALVGGSDTLHAADTTYDRLNAAKAYQVLRQSDSEAGGTGS